MTPTPLPEAPTERAADSNGRPHAVPDDDRVPGVRHLADVLAELAAVLPGLKSALDCQSRSRVEPLAYRKRDVARLCSISPRLLERLLSAGRFPKPDAHAGKCPLWTRPTLERWLAQGGGRI
jgi:hypothetical protein